jgi:hypothetical protein
MRAALIQMRGDRSREENLDRAEAPDAYGDLTGR